MTENTSPEPGQPERDFPEVRALLAAGNKIGAITRLREQTDWSLAQAKAYVDALPYDPSSEGEPEDRTPVSKWAWRLLVVLFGFLGIVTLFQRHYLEASVYIGCVCLFALARIRPRRPLLVWTVIAVTALLLVIQLVLRFTGRL